MIRTTWTTHALVAALAFLYLGPAAPPLLAQRDLWVWVERYQFTIDTDTPLKDLLPVPPPSVPIRTLLVAELAAVPEVQFQEPYLLKVEGKGEAAREAAEEKAMIAVAHQIAKINFLNRQRPDRFMERLLEQRPDLAGLPFTLGDACRVPDAERAQFRTALREVQQLILATRECRTPKRSPAEELERIREAVEDFWDNFDKRHAARAKAKVQPVADSSKIAALMQVLGPEPPQFHPGLVQRLAAQDKSAAAREHSTVALARLAVFAREVDTRRAAAAALKGRDTAAATPVLLHGLRYPWPDVARNAADAIVALQRTDLAAELVNLLDEPDPRAPAAQTVGGKQVLAVRELVRVNHQRNCLLCHAPGNSPDIFGPVRESQKAQPVAGVKGAQSQRVGLQSMHSGADLAPVLVPGVPLPPPPSGYSQFRTPDLFIRADVTYLRQDFSVMQKVPDAAPWPELQRFDFLVRTRAVTALEAAAYRAEFAGQNNPYRLLALDALRALTGQDAGTTAAEWRAALEQR
jgi:hypothetical protein